ncbi:unnamed protein product [Caenorhabditis sp. 36 PRJEB53466]|nr:unnamed protein product [Caenorhabditis sp. 36 PRJEB53466]
MTTTSGNELAQCLETHLTPLNEIDDSVATSSAECNYEDHETFTEAVDLTFFEQDLTEILKELKKRAENLLLSDEKCDIRLVFEEGTVATMKFNLFVWHFLESGIRSESSEDEVERAVLAACVYLSMCAMPHSNQDLFQPGLYSKCLKLIRNCCQTVRIGETVAAKKNTGAKKKGGKSGSEEQAADETGAAAAAEPKIGPPRIAVDSAERFLHQLTTQMFGFLVKDSFSLDQLTLMSTLEVIEDIPRLDLDTRAAPRAYRANSVREFRSLDRFMDRYCSFVNALIESKYKTRGELAYGRLIRPRLAFLPYPDESTKQSKVSGERKKVGELTACLVVSRIGRNPDARELKLIESVVAMVYAQCPEYAEFRANIAQTLTKILEALPYQFVYDFVQLMNVLFKGKSNVRSLSNELANNLLFAYNFTAPDPGPVPDLENAEQDEEEEDKGSEDEGEKGKNSDSDDDSDGDANTSRRRKLKAEERRKKKEQQKAKDRVTPAREDACSILYNIIYAACLDKTAGMRVHGISSFAKILSSPVHRKAFQECCQKTNVKMDEKFGEAGENLNELLDTSAQSENGGSKKGKHDLLRDEQEIIQKINRLELLNKGAARVEKDIIYMMIRRLTTDDKAPVKKGACGLLRVYLMFCEEEVKFDTMLSTLQKLCRDKQVSVRKVSAEVFTDLMLQGNITFKESLSSKWLHSLITMLNDTDSDVTEHARKLIMKVLTPLLENPSDLTWTLLDTIESVTNHRQYLMTTLKDAVREKLVKRSVMESMKRHIVEGGERQSGTWMVFSQLCVQFEANVDFAVEAFHSMDLSVESNLVQYMVHVIENNVDKIEEDAKTDLQRSLQRTLQNYCLHASHAKSVYHCLGKVMDGIGDRAKNGPAFRDFADSLLIKCFDTIVQSFEMFKDKEAWKRVADSQERLLIIALNVASEVFSFSPSLIPRHERLGKTLSLIVNSRDEQTSDASAINPDMPSVHQTRPQTQMSEFPSSQKTAGGLLSHEEGLLFSDKVRAISVITLANMILAHDRLLKLMPMLVKQLQMNPSHQIRSNIVVAIGDICASFKTDRYAPMLAASLCDASVLVRRHAINQIARLITFGIFRFNGEIMIRMMLATLDANEDVRNDAKLYISEVLQSEEPAFFKLNFVQYMLALTQAKRLIGTNHDEEDRGQVDVAIGGGDPLARPSRIAIYTFMIESLDDRARFDVKVSICKRIFTPIVNGEYDFSDHNVQCLLDDALLIMASTEMQVKMDIGRNPDENAVDDPAPEAMAAAAAFMQKVYFDLYMNTIVPSTLALREFLNQHRSPLQRKCLVAIRMICMEHKDDLDKILQDNRQLKEEMKFELQRVKQRNEEANKILDQYLKKVADFHKQQKLIARQQDGKEPGEEDEQQQQQQEAAKDVEMTSPVRNNPEIASEDGTRTPPPQRQLLEGLKTPGTALRSRTESQQTPQTRVLSPKTIRKIRRSVGALIKSNEMRLNAPNLEDTRMSEAVDKTVAGENEIEKEKTIVDESMEQNEEAEKTVTGQVKEADEDVEKEKSRETEQEPEAQQLKEPEPENREKPVAAVAVEEQANRSKSRRRKTPTYDEDESVDADGKVWKKPKIVMKSPEKPADISMNVTVRRSHRARPSERQDEAEKKKKKSNKRKAMDEDEEETEGNEENAPMATPRGTTPLVFDENKVGAGRQCSTPIRGRDECDPNNVTFALDVSAITEKEELKTRKSQAQILHNIFEDDEEEV